MDDLEFVLEKSKTTYNTACYPGEYVFRHACTLKFIQGPGVHKLHTIVDARLDEECSIEFYDFWGDGTMENVQFHNDGI
jgi:hypothetical protein